jgi:carotenoid cleavage dioxygenase-like enzyme
VLLSLALDGRADRSVLLCLDAETLTERARAPLPHRLPYGFHGQFYGTTDPGRSMA